VGVVDVVFRANPRPGGLRLCVDIHLQCKRHTRGQGRGGAARASRANGAARARGRGITARA
jgi:hypothetical protein